MLYVHTKLGPSAIAGIGLFATQFIPKGTPVWKMTHGIDIEIPLADIAALPEPARKQIEHYGFRNHGEECVVLCADDARFFNHADDANCVDAPDPDDPWGMTIAARDIQPGEELTCDYKAFDADAAAKLG